MAGLDSTRAGLMEPEQITTTGPHTPAEVEQTWLLQQREQEETEARITTTASGQAWLKRVKAL